MSSINHDAEPSLKPIPFWQSSILFLGSGGVAAFLINGVVPWLVTLGFEGYSALMISSVILFGFLTVVMLALYLGEGRKLRWPDIKERLRIRNISVKQWLLVAVGVLIVIVSYIGLQFTVGPIMKMMPDWLTAPHQFDDPIDRSGDYIALVWFSALIIFNVVSEELLWRGYLLPRQELQHGRHTWWIHGIQWTCFHWFKPWDLIVLLPGALVYGWLCTRTKSMIPGLVLHFGLNGLGILLLATRVLN